MNGLHLILPFNYQQYFHKSCVPVLSDKKINISHLISTISTFNQAGYSRSSTAQQVVVIRPQPPASEGGRVPAGSPLKCLYVHMVLSHGCVQQSEVWLSRSRSAAQLTEWCSATAGHTRHECFHPLVLLAAMLTLLLAHIPPLSGCNIVYILSQDCFGQFS